MDTLAAHFAFAFFWILDFVGLNMLAYNLSDGNYFECLHRVRSWGKVDIEIGCYSVIPYGYGTMVLILLASIYFYKKSK